MVWAKSYCSLPRGNAHLGSLLIWREWRICSWDVIWEWLNNNNNQPKYFTQVWWHTPLIPALRGRGSESEIYGLVYRMDSKTVRAALRDSVSTLQLTKKVCVRWGNVCSVTGFTHATLKWATPPAKWLLITTSMWEFSTLRKIVYSQVSPKQNNHWF